MKPSSQTPKLAPPGAGLPWLELQIARWMFRRFRKRCSKEEANALLQHESAVLKTHVESVSKELAERQVLINRLRGMEDSSRNWSMLMTLEHLCIVNEAITKIIHALSRGIVPPGEVSTAAVKPKSGSHDGIIERFLASTDSVCSTAERISNMETTAHYKHPWFGPLNAAEWHFLAAFHQRLHRKQVEAILNELSE